MHSIAIRVEGIERRKRSTGLFHIVAGLFLIANASEYFKQSLYQNFWSVLPVFLVAFISLFYGFFRRRLDPMAHYNHWVRMLQFLMFSMLGVFMLQTHADFRVVSLFLWAVISILLLFTERKIFHDAYLAFNHNNISIPGYFSTRVMPWSVIESVVIRPDYVTIYYPNNKFVQYEVLNSIDSSTIEKINNFCSQKIAGKEVVR